MEAEASQDDLAGVVGIACRVPGASSESELWNVLDERRELRQKVPKDRFNVDAWYHPIKSTKGKTNAQYAYFMDGSVKAFDAAFFKISRKEAEAMDPQQRIILEVVYEALENAGLTLDDMAGSATSVYCGSSTDDYSAVSTTDMSDYPTYANTGTGPCIMANRVSYFFDLKGESILVNTACSSALVCLHLGSESIKSRYSDMCIVVGSSLLLEPRPFVTMADFGMLSADGYSRAFDKAGQGFVRGEGVCAMVLKRVADARADGDAVKAIIRGSFTNHDGASKKGLTVPSTAAQIALIRKAYQRADVSPRDTTFIEAHGTGTPVGDPIEAAALQAVFGSGDRRSPTFVGSVKTVIGHLEGGAGLMGAIKAVMCVQRGLILGNKNLNDPRPEFCGGRKLRIPTETISWPSIVGPRRASVNSFGYGGSNAHCIIEEYRTLSKPQVTSPDLEDACTYLLPLSAHTATAGALLIDKIVQYVRANQHASVSRLATTLSTRRTAHKYRAYVLAKDRSGLLSELGRFSSKSAWKHVKSEAPRLGFVFTGQGAQWAQMGLQLLLHVPQFEEVIARCQAVLDSVEINAPSWTIREELQRPRERSKVNEAEFSQPICTAIQIGLVEVLAAWNITPSAVVGHSSGEIAAAYASGRLSLKDAMVTAFYRGLYTSSAYQIRFRTPHGAMLAVGMPESRVRLALQPYGGKIDIAAINSPSLVTVSGDADAIKHLSDAWNQQGVWNRRLAVDQAYHSYHMRAMASMYLKALSSQADFVSLDPACIPMYSSVTGESVPSQQIHPEYWVQNMISPVRFQDAIIDAVTNETSAYKLDALIEIGPHPALKKPSEETMKDINRLIPYLSTLFRSQDDTVALLETAGELFELGCSVHLGDVLALAHGLSSSQHVLPTRLENFPTYPFDHAEYWYQSRMTAATFHRSYYHTLLGTPSGESTSFCQVWRNFLRLRDLPWISDHKVQNVIVFPASGYISIAVEAAFRQIEDNRDFAELILDNVSIISPLVLPDDEIGIETVFQLARSKETLHAAAGGTYTFSFSSFDRRSSASKEHCTGQISISQQDGSPRKTSSLVSIPSAAQAVFDFVMSKDELYNRFQSLGLQYGQSFRLIEGQIMYKAGAAKAVARHESAALCTVQQDHCILHPTFFDASLHPLLAAIEGLLETKPTEPTVPQSFGSIRISKAFISRASSERATCLDVLATAKALDNHGYSGDLVIADTNNGKTLISVQTLRLASLDRALSTTPPRKVFSKVRWLPAFGTLGNDSKSLPANIWSAIEVFCHESPKANILLICDSPQAILHNLLSVLCNGNPAHRRFAKLTIPGFHECLESIGLHESFKTAIGSNLPTSKTFDLAVVFDDHAQHDIPALLNQHGSILTNKELLDQLQTSPASFETQFTSSGFSCFRRVPHPSADNRSQRLDIIHDGNQGACRSVFQYELKSQFSPSGVNIGAVASVDTTAPFMVVISCLNTDLLWEGRLVEDNTAARGVFAAIKKILLMEDKTILWLLRGAMLSAEKPQQAMMMGMIRAARNENSRSRIITLDIGTSSDMQRVAKFASMILSRSRNEDEFAIHDGALQIPRLYLDEELNACNNGSIRRETTEKSWFSDSEIVLRPSGHHPQPLEFVEVWSDCLADYQLEIEVHASSVTPKDVLNAQQRSSVTALGNDCAGIVTAKGVAVPDSVFRPGDKVYFCAQGYGTHRNVLRVSSLLCVKLAQEDDLAVCTSWYKELALAKHAIFTRCRVTSRDRVFVACTTPCLIHLLIRMCQALNAPVTIFATQLQDKTFWKSQYPSLEIVTQLDGTLQRQRYRKALFDVIVHEVPGRDLDAFSDLLAPRGKFLGIQSEGEEDLHPSPELWPLSARVEVLNVASGSPQALTVIAQLIQGVPQFLRNNLSLNLCPPPFETVSFADCNDAYPLAERLQAIRKVVLTVEAGPEEVTVHSRKTTIWKGSLDSGKTYLLVGGFSGLGRALAIWLVKKGARNLAFLSRSGKKSAAAQEVVQHLHHLGTNVQVYDGDVTDLRTVQDCINDLSCPLGGVFHMAMLLKDNPISTMSYKLWHMGVEPKAQGAVNICVAIGSQPIDFFICFSSTSAIFGPPGQANYAAGNCFMDTLMRQRRLKGLPGTSLNIGMITDVGVVSDNHLLLNRMRAQGFDPLTIYDVYAQVEAALAQASPLQAADAEGFEHHQIVSGAYASSTDIFSYSRSLCQCLASILDNTQADFALPAAGDGSTDHRANEEDAQMDDPIEALQRLIAGITGLQPASISASQPLTMYGIDSISGVEVRAKIRQATGIEIALFEILGGVTIETLAKRIAMPSKEDKSPPSTRSDALSLKSGTIPPETQLQVETHEEMPFSTDQMILPLSKISASNPVLSTFALYGPTRPEVLRAALLELVRRNPTLRTSIPLAQISPLVPHLWQYTDLTGHSDVPAELRAQLDALRQWQFKAGLSLRVLLVRRQPLIYSLTFAFHRSISDRDMPRKIFDQFVSLCDCFSRDHDPDAAEYSAVQRLDTTQGKVWKSKDFVAVSRDELNRPMPADGQLPTDETDDSPGSSFVFVPEVNIIDGSQ